MQSFQMALEERNFRILDVLIDLTQKMVEGELIQLEKIGRIDVTEDDALRLATYKTACLFSGCAPWRRARRARRGKKRKRLRTTAVTPASLFNWWMISWISPPPQSS